MIYYSLSFLSFLGIVGMVIRKLYLVSLISEEYSGNNESFIFFLKRHLEKILFIFNSLLYKKLFFSILEKVFIKMKVFFLKLHNINHDMAVKIKSKIQNLEK